MADSLVTEDSSISKVLKDFGNEMQESLRRSLRSKDANVTYELEQSIDFSAKLFGSTFTFKLFLADYYDFLNKGVSGNQVKRNTPYSYGNKMPNVSKLTQWVNNRGLTTDAKKRKGIAFGIAKKIKKEGTKGNKFYDEVVTEDRLKQLRRDIAKASSKDVLTFITKESKKIFGDAAVEGKGITRG